MKSDIFALFFRLFIEEETLNLTLAILREQGTFGEVSVFCFAQSLVGGAIRGQDFNFEPRVSTRLLHMKEPLVLSSSTFEDIKHSLYKDFDKNTF